jgi:GNAT superfamily N-acetyltransferase
VHWVAIVPEQQGRGLGKVLMTIVCHRLRELGHRRTYLTTSTARIPAINLYRHFDFVPLIRAPDDAAIWRELNRCLKNPCPVG